MVEDNFTFEENVLLEETRDLRLVWGHKGDVAGKGCWVSWFQQSDSVTTLLLIWLLSYFKCLHQSDENKAQASMKQNYPETAAYNRSYTPLYCRLSCLLMIININIWIASINNETGWCKQCLIVYSGSAHLQDVVFVVLDCDASEEAVIHNW